MFLCVAYFLVIKAAAGVMILKIILLLFIFHTTGYNYSAPYWMGEFGTGTSPDNEKWDNIVQFLRETDHDWAYWSIDGYKYPGQDEGNSGIWLFSYMKSS